MSNVTYIGYRIGTDSICSSSSSFGPSVPTNVADHTFVWLVDENGTVREKYGAYGRNDAKGKVEICRGKGNYTKGKCMSEQGGVANIIYAVHGVCHQVCNRILYPSGCTVSRSKGYPASIALYGTYGTSTVTGKSTWALKQVACIIEKPDWLPWTATPDLEEEEFFERSYVNDTFVLNNNAGSMSYDEYCAREIELIVNRRLGKTLSKKEMGEIQLTGINARKEFNQLVQAYEKRQLRPRTVDRALSPEQNMTREYKQLLNELVTRMLQQFSKTLKNENDFMRIWDYYPEGTVEFVSVAADMGATTEDD